MAKVIAITLYRRPSYTQKLFESLVKAYGIEDYRILISCDVSREHYADCDTVQEMAWVFKHNHPGKCDIFVNDPRLGIDKNKLFILPRAFEHTNYVVFLEDDTPIAQDGLRYFEAMNEMFADDKSVISISGYNRYLESETHTRVLAEETYHIARGGQFAPWGFAIWKDRYDLIVGMDGQKYLEATGENANGLFDHNMCRWMRENAPVWTIYPVLGRTNHTGAYGAEHTPSAEWLMEHEFAPFGSWSQDMPDPLGKEWVRKW